MNGSTAATPRLIIADDNIRDVGGHYFELANLLLSGGRQLGYRGVLATHASFTDLAAVDRAVEQHPTFHTRRLMRWSLGVDGQSKFQRNRDGCTIGGRPLENFAINLIDRLRPKRSPQTMLRQWAGDLRELLQRIQPTGDDVLLINTGDDFALLALAAAMNQFELPRLRIDVIFHFALYDPQRSDYKPRLKQLGRQIRAARSDLQQHSLHLHATTQSLATQLRESEPGAPINPIPYPTRRCHVSTAATSLPLKVVFAGLPRAEKGSAAIINLLAAMEPSLLRNKRFRVSLQLPSHRGESMIPRTLQPAYQRACQGSSDEPLEVMSDNLSPADYHAWLDTANVGVFLYDPARYLARCSGVLLELLARGIPVIVPDRCWLADQVRLAGGHRSIGFIYQDRAEIPDLLRQFLKHYARISARARGYSEQIRRRHNGKNTLLEMGVPPAGATLRVA